MKIKSDFVTNSSSVSFMLEKKKLRYDEIFKINELKKRKDLNFIENQYDFEDDFLEFSIGDRDRDDIKERIQETLEKLGKFASCGYIDYDR